MVAKFLVVVGLTLIPPIVALAQDNADTQAHGTDSAANTADEAQHNAIRQLRDNVIKAINDKDSDALIDSLHPQIVLTAQDGAKLNVIRNHDGVREYLDRLFLGPDAGVKELTVAPKVDDLTILYGDDTGVAFGSSLDHYVLADGATFDLPTRWSATLVRDGDDWKIANLHVSTNLFSNPVLDAARRCTGLIATACGVVGLLIGGVVTWLATRSRTRKVG